MKKVLAVIGAQYGSEGKGVIVHHLANRYDIHVRVGGPNAGHTFLYDGHLYKMRSIPCGWTNPDAELIIGRGAIVDPEQLVKELEIIKAVDPGIEHRLLIDEGAWAIEGWDRETEKEVGLRESIGSTLEGVGNARLRRIGRSLNLDTRMFKVAREYGLEKMLHSDTAVYLNIARGLKNILLEGTQGSGLSLLHGEWPFVTSADTNAAQLLADVGLAPNAMTDCLLVTRTHPIRVGGNSGPLRNEIDWKTISERMGRPTEEVTTVTGRVRRIGNWDSHLVRRARMLNGPTAMALTFLDYWHPDMEGRTVLSGEAIGTIEEVEREQAITVALVGTGGPNLTVVEYREGLV